MSHLTIVSYFAPSNLFHSTLSPPSLALLPSPDEICLHVASPPTTATLAGLTDSQKRSLALLLSPIVLEGEKPAYTRRKFRPAIQEKLEIITSMSRRMLAWCTGQRDEKAFLSGVSSSGTILPWIHCQGKGKGGCLKRPEEEMMQCGRVSLGC